MLDRNRIDIRMDHLDCLVDVLIEIKSGGLNRTRTAETVNTLPTLPPGREHRDRNRNRNRNRNRMDHLDCLLDVLIEIKKWRTQQNENGGDSEHPPCPPSREGREE
jgi:hypothetical protein